MIIGIPRERKLLEGRIALTPHAVAALVKNNHVVLIETQAGLKSGYDDADYLVVGGQIVDSLVAVYEAELVVKVKEPTEQEVNLLRKDQLLFCYLHLAAYPSLLQSLLSQQVTALAFETLTVNNFLPLLAPMSAIAGQLSMQLAMHYLQSIHGGAGVLLGGVLGTATGRVVVVGAGVAGRHAALMAAAIGAEVYVLDKSLAALDYLKQQNSTIHTLVFSEQVLAQLLPQTDVIIGAVLIKGANAPRLLTHELQQLLPEGRVIVDIAIDQGGCVEGIQPTDWQQPIYWLNGRGYVAVTNMPAAVPRTATQALSSVILPYVQKVAAGDLATDAILQTAVAVKAGNIIHPALIS